MGRLASSAHVCVRCVLCSQVLWAVARLLQLQHNQVHVTCRRVGGGFGGKVGCWRLLAGSALPYSVQAAVLMMLAGLKPVLPAAMQGALAATGRAHLVTACQCFFFFIKPLQASSDRRPTAHMHLLPLWLLTALLAFPCCCQADRAIFPAAAAAVAARKFGRQVRLHSDNYSRCQRLMLLGCLKCCLLPVSQPADYAHDEGGKLLFVPFTCESGGTTAASA